MQAGRGRRARRARGQERQAGQAACCLILALSCSRAKGSCGERSTGRRSFRPRSPWPFCANSRQTTSCAPWPSKQKLAARGVETAVSPTEATGPHSQGLHTMGGTGLEPVTPSLSTRSGRSARFAEVRSACMVERNRADERAPERTRANASERRSLPVLPRRARRVRWRVGVSFVRKSQAGSRRFESLRGLLRAPIEEALLLLPRNRRRMRAPARRGVGSGSR
jgi:hypothetical protein